MAAPLRPPPPDDGLRLYLREVERLAWPSPSEASASVERSRRGSRTAYAELVAAYLPLVVCLARRRRGAAASRRELIAEGNAGLLHAVLKFDPDAGCRLTTYVRWWATEAIDRSLETSARREPLPARSLARMLAWPSLARRAEIGRDLRPPPHAPAPDTRDEVADPPTAAFLAAHEAAFAVFAALDPLDREILARRPAIAGSPPHDRLGLDRERDRTHADARRLEHDALSRFLSGS